MNKILSLFLGLAFSASAFAGGTVGYPPNASSSTFGIVKVDGSTITASNGVISATGTTSPLATTTTAGIVIVPTANNLTIDGSGNIGVPLSTSSTFGVVKPDGTVITSSGGVITVATATSSALGVVKVDNSTITASSGVISGASTTISGTSTAPGGSISLATILGTTPVSSQVLLGSSSTALSSNSGFTSDSSGNVLERSVVINSGGSAVPSPGTATSLFRFTKQVTAIPENSATSILSISVPNSACGAGFYIYVVSSAGAGGAVGAYETTAINAVFICVTRTAGKNAAASAVFAFGGSGTGASVAGGTAFNTDSVTLGAVSGGTSAVNTIAVNLTLAVVSGSSTNHTALVTVDAMNATASGVTIQ